MKRVLVAFAVIIFIALFFTVTSLMFIGPRMRTQPSIQEFQAQMPTTPKDSIPVKDTIPDLQLTAIKLEPTKENIARGKTYYEYYCRFCHGDKADGHGPVGESYDPIPSDLRSQKIQNYPDGELLQKSLTGTGHSPVLNRVVLPEHRWYIVLYLKNLP